MIFDSVMVAHTNVNYYASICFVTDWAVVLILWSIGNGCHTLGLSTLCLVTIAVLIGWNLCGCVCVEMGPLPRVCDRLRITIWSVCSTFLACYWIAATPSQIWCSSSYHHRQSTTSSWMTARSNTEQNILQRLVDWRACLTKKLIYYYFILYLYMCHIIH